MSPGMAISDDASGSDEYQKGVKQLVENGLNTVPKKYILPPSDRPAASQDTNMANHNLHLPIIDFSDLLGPNRPQVLQDLANACEQYGFFQVVNHGISDDVMKSMMDVSGRFFDLPFEERAKKVAATYAEETKHLFLMLMEAILESLGIMEANQEKENINILKEMEDGSQLMVVNFYPPCPEPDLTLGMPPHSDYGFLTLLLQDEVEGLQIQFQGKWFTVQPINNSFVVNVGDHLEQWEIQERVHRVLVNSAKRRRSVASLHSLPFNSTVRPSPKLIDETNPKRYADTDFETFLAYISTTEPKGKSFLDSGN
ncbi:Oxoglutarate/iron-dependent dioxygenase [Sesbania bispinosa]|nr:Oxoglutarate/iron-dependent dioxygenase [Sesbania bispinosa]